MQTWACSAAFRKDIYADRTGSAEQCNVTRHQYQHTTMTITSELYFTPLLWLEERPLYFPWHLHALRAQNALHIPIDVPHNVPVMIWCKSFDLGLLV